MPTYVLMSRLTPDGRRTLHENPTRLEAVNKEIRQLGCKVVTQYALLGGYDFLTIIDAPDNETAAQLSVELGARGTIEITTLPAIAVMQLTKKLGGPRQITKGNNHH